jgi:hypothetical protein
MELGLPNIDGFGTIIALEITNKKSGSELQSIVGHRPTKNYY